MSAAGTTSAITFLLYIGLTLVFPSFPPAQLLYESVNIPPTTLSVWGISIATLFNGIINGIFWAIIFITTYGLARLAVHARRRRLPPMPVAPHLTEPPPENPIVDPRINRIPPALTIPPESSSTVRKEPPRPLMRTELAPIRVSRESMGAELDIEAIEGIGPVHGALLRNSGVDTVIDLLRVGATQRGRHRLANELGVTYATVLRWVHRGDLLRVKGIGRKYSALLESAGINTVTDLSTKDPHNLCKTLKTVNRERNLVRRSPLSRTLEIWVGNARALEPILVE